MPYETLSQVSEDLNLDLNYIFKPNTKKAIVLDKDEELLIKALRNLTEQERKKVYLGLNTLISAKEKIMRKTHERTKRN